MFFFALIVVVGLMHQTQIVQRVDVYREVIASPFYIHNPKMAETVLPFLPNQYTPLIHMGKIQIYKFFN